ncbi:hypothetical protein VTL71DRAFT_1169 [Oculimacula yallundae]|uniref:Amidoligase enzyme n=1 Tax=Oculimacula yallundae TaxID=86028 RepID=A0ABR4D234_9HELO
MESLRAVGRFMETVGLSHSASAVYRHPNRYIPYTVQVETMSYHFGVEIEIISEPHTVQNPLLRAFYYEKVAAALRARGQPSVADTLQDRYRKRAEHYDKWWITKDGSLGNPDHPLIPLEAVSPILTTDEQWEADIDMFWSSWSKVFHMPTSSNACGSHIHVSSSSKNFSVAQLRRIAFGVFLYENNVLQILPASRRTSKWCKSNFSTSAFSWDKEYDITDTQHLKSMRDSIWNDFETEGDLDELPRLMQWDSRRVLWNFQNIRKSGTIEFRGGPRLRGPVHTKRWIAFVVSFIHMCVSKNFGQMRRSSMAPLSMAQFWSAIRTAASDCRVRDSLPRDWEVMIGTSA